ncbi:MAG: hypothetical protein M3Y74_03805 [Chloroflexota bacterium]|nr:hypothetical protein [Chloroflexota bacterium]
MRIRSASPARGTTSSTGCRPPTVKDGVIDVWDRPGLGVEFTVRAARAQVMDEDRSFFD